MYWTTLMSEARKRLERAWHLEQVFYISKIPVKILFPVKHRKRRWSGEELSWKELSQYLEHTNKSKIEEKKNKIVITSVGRSPEMTLNIIILPVPCVSKVKFHIPVPLNLVVWLVGQYRSAEVMVCSFEARCKYHIQLLPGSLGTLALGASDLEHAAAPGILYRNLGPLTGREVHRRTLRDQTWCKPSFMWSSL